jgi:hypothetical protein
MISMNLSKAGKSGFTTYYGWLVPFTLNAKNSYGGYVGNDLLIC